MLARLRIPSGWDVEYNALFEPLDGSDLPHLGNLTEDILQFVNRRRRVIVDLGWYPECDPTGLFRLQAVASEFVDNCWSGNWDSPLRDLMSTSYSEIVAALEAWLEDESLTLTK